MIEQATTVGESSHCCGLFDTIKIIATSKQKIRINQRLSPVDADSFNRDLSSAVHLKF